MVVGVVHISMRRDSQQSNFPYVRTIQMLKFHQRRIAVSIKNGVLHARWRDQKNSEPPLDGQKAKFDFDWVPLFTLCLTVCTSTAFGAGKAYRAQYLRAFGFTGEAIPWSFQDVVYLGITKQIDILLLAPMVAAEAVAIFLGLAVLLLWLDERLADWRAVRKSKKLGSSKSAQMNPRMDSLLVVSLFLLKCLGFIFVVGWSAAFFVVQAEQRGMKDAKAAKESVTQGSKEDSKLPYVTIERRVGEQKIIETGYLFSCSERACGLYSPPSDNRKEVSRLVSMDNVTSFRTGD